MLGLGSAAAGGGAFRSVVAVVAMIGSSMKKARVSGLCDDLSLDVV